MYLLQFLIREIAQEAKQKLALRNLLPCNFEFDNMLPKLIGTIIGQIIVI